MYVLFFFVETTLGIEKTGEAVVSRGNEASSCSQTQSPEEDALYIIVSSKRRRTDQAVRVGESNLPRQNPPPERVTVVLGARCARARRPRCRGGRAGAVSGVRPGSPAIQVVAVQGPPPAPSGDVFSNV